MGEYHGAMVQFTSNGRQYPVNCPPWLEVGAWIMVRFAGVDTHVKSAKIIEQIETRRPCKHSVVCRVSEHAQYGDGPLGVCDLNSLEKFLEFQGWQAFETVGEGSETCLTAEFFHRAFVDWKPDPWETNISRTLRGPRRIIYIGTPDFSFGDRSHHLVARGMSTTFGATLLNHKLVISAFDYRKTFSSDNPFREAAEWSEDLHWPIEGPDKSISEIREASGGYLGDDIYI